MYDFLTHTDDVEQPEQEEEEGEGASGEGTSEEEGEGRHREEGGEGSGRESLLSALYDDISSEEESYSQAGEEVDRSNTFMFNSLTRPIYEHRTPVCPTGLFTFLKSVAWGFLDHENLFAKQCSPIILICLLEP